MSIRIDDWFVAGNAQKTNSDWNATSGFAQILNKPTNLVHTTGDETIAGIKTFSSIPQSVTPEVSSEDTSIATTEYVANKITQHSGNTTAHSDIRQAISDVNNNISSSINIHDISNTSHSDIRQLISNVNTNISTEVGNHNNNTLAHSDIRQAVNNNSVLISSVSDDLIQETNQRNSDVNNLQQQIDALSSKGDVADIVGTYQDLLNYDTSTLLNKSIIKVLSDSTHDNTSSYYKWNTNTSAFDYVGSEAPTYNKTEIDEMDNAVVHKANIEEITGQKTFKNTILNVGKVTPTTSNSTGIFDLRIYDASSNLRGLYEVWRGNNNDTTTVVRACNTNGTSEDLRVTVYDDNTVSTYAPTPSNDSNDNNIATTEWVNSNISANSGVVHTTGNESIADTKTFTGNIIKSVDLATAAAAGVTYLRTEDTSNKGRASLQSYYTNSQVYNRFATNNTTSGKYGYLDVIVKDTEEFYAGISGNGTNLSLTKVTNTTSDTTVPTMGWVNNPATATNVVHRSGDETIAGIKSFSTLGTTFTSQARLKAVNSTWDDTTRETAEYNQYSFQDKNGVNVSFLEEGWNTDGSRVLQFVTRNFDNTTWEHPLQFITSNSSTSSEVKTYANFDWTFNRTINGTAYRAQWGDLAEHYITDEQYPKGTLVQFGGEKEITIAKNKVNAVITSEPGFILNGEMEDSQAIALIGRVPVRVIGKVKKFDKIALSYIDGVGCSNNDSENPLGIALEDKNDSEEGLIICSVKLSF